MFIPILLVISLCTQLATAQGLFNSSTNFGCSIDIGFNETNETSSNKILPCKTFHVFEIIERTQNSANISTPESQIASEGHWEGIKPDHYRISLNFTNATYYLGALAIDITVTAPTNKIYLHKAPKLNVDFGSIYVEQTECKPGTLKSKQRLCIENVTVAGSQSLILIQLSSNLVPESKYTIVVPKFKSIVPFYPPYDIQNSASGAFWSDSEGNGYLKPGVPAALSTVFRPREARTAFPCFDHPRLKASYTLCIEHSDTLLSRSNSPIRSSVIHPTNPKRKKTCFETTPPISTYVFTYALLHEYDTEQRLVDTDLVVELVTPRGQGLFYRWIYDAVVEPMRFMGGSTQLRYPIKRIGFIIITPFPYAGVDNFGLITLNGKVTKGTTPELAGRVLVNHEIVHQWFGGIVTMTDWKEICVQEGITAFYEWVVTAQTLKPALIGINHNLTVNERARRTLTTLKDDYPPFFRDFKTNREILDTCYNVPPLIFKTLSDAFGDQIFYRLFSEIAGSFQYDNADVDTWDEALEKISDRQDLRGYMKSWFSLPGYPRLFVSKVGQSISLEQDRSAGVRPIPVRVLESNATNGQPGPVVVINTQTTVIPVTDQFAAWVLVNPDDDSSPIRKIYSLDHYRRFVVCNASRPEDCAVNAHANTRERRKIAGREFCTALLEERLPWGKDETVENVEKWEEVLEGYVKKGELEKDCECCLRSKGMLKTVGKSCAKMWNTKCRNLRINKQLGRTYKVDEE